jgi:hypothetical protein
MVHSIKINCQNVGCQIIFEGNGFAISDCERNISTTRRSAGTVVLIPAFIVSDLGLVVSLVEKM